MSKTGSIKSELEHHVIVIAVKIIHPPLRLPPLPPAAPGGAAIAARPPPRRLCRTATISSRLLPRPPRLLRRLRARQLRLPRCLPRRLLRLCCRPVGVALACCAAGPGSWEGCWRLCHKLAELSRPLPVLGCSGGRAGELGDL